MGFISFQRSAISQRATRAIMFLIALIFVAGALFSFGSSRRAGCLAEPHSPPVARVFRAEISKRTFLNAWRQMLDQSPRLASDPTRVAESKNALLDTMVEGRLVEIEAERRKIRPSRKEVQQRMQEAVEMRVAALGTGAQRKQKLRQMGLTQEQYRQQVEEEVKANRSTYYFRALQDKLKQAVIEDMKRINPQLARKYRGAVKARQIVIKYRPEGAAAQGSDEELTRDEAKRKAEEIYKKLKAGEDFAKIARKESMDEESRKKGGDIGYVTNSPYDYRLPGTVKDALFALDPGEVSEPIEPPGWNAFYIVKAEDVELDEDAAFDAFLQKFKEKANVQVLDPELKAYRVLIAAEDDKDKRQALKLYEQALADEERSDADKAHIYYQMGRIYEELGENEKAVAAYKRAIELHGGAASLYLALGKLYKRMGEKEKALGAFENAGEVGYADFFVHLELKRLYEEMGETEKAAEEQRAIEQIQKAGGGFRTVPFSVE